MKKILIFSLSYIPHVGGAEVAMRAITNRITDIEWHMVTLRFDNEPKEEKIGNIFVHRVGFGSSYISKSLFIFSATRKAIELNKKYKFDASWSMMSYMLLPIVFLRIFGIKIPYALTLQEGDTYNYMFKRPHVIPFLPMLSFGFKNATSVQAISNYLGVWAKKRGYSGVIEIIPNGVDSWWLAQDSKSIDRQRLWKNHDMSGNEKIIITTSRLVNKNAVDVVIHSMKLLPDNFHFVVLGIGKEEGRLKDLTNRLGLNKRIHFIGEVSNSKIIDYLHSSDIFTRPSRSEGMGNSFIEAMAAGLPVVATQVGGISDFLFDPDLDKGKISTGLAVPVDSPQHVASQIKRLIDDNNLRERIIKNARDFVSDKYDWDTISRDMRFKVFGKILK